MAWPAHTAYHDHTYEAMELIKMCARTKEEQRVAFQSAKRGMEYYLMVLNACYQEQKCRL
jgi:pyrroloquinoline quinone (PQQ) biosynthesis protein C